MRYGKAFGWALTIYAIMFLSWSGFVTYGVAGTLLSQILGFCVLVALTTAAERSLTLPTWRDVLPYSLIWALGAAILDAIFAVPFAGWTMYLDLNVWIGYTLVAIIPLLSSTIFPKIQKRLQDETHSA